MTIDRGGIESQGYKPGEKSSQTCVIYDYRATEHAQKLVKTGHVVAEMLADRRTDMFITILPHLLAVE